MIQFKEINGQLCLMLEKPIPLTEKSKFPCVARLIQDDSPMGRFNSGKTAYINDIYICDGIGEHGSCAISSNNNLHHPACLEIIGYPVADHSAEWALYRMMQGGDKVTKRHLKHTYWHYDARPHLKCISQYNCGMLQIMVSPEIWIKTADREGWQIYAEPKPLPAEAKVGDLCQRRDGKWVQIDAIRNNGNKWSIYEAEGHSYHESGNAVCSELYHTELDIISTEPLAPIGSAEWAWQMWQLGNSVHNTGSHLLWSGDRKVKNVSKEQWLKELASFPTGWQLYEPKPAPLAVQVGDYVRTAKGDGKVIEIPLTMPEVMLSNGQRGSFHADEISGISPAEMVIHIGCLSGTVRSRDNKSFHLLRKGKNTMVIYFDALDTPTRKLVLELIEKQEEEK